MAKYTIIFSYGYDKQFKGVVDYLLEGGFACKVDYNPDGESKVTFECSVRMFENIRRYWLPKECQIIEESK